MTKPSGRRTLLTRRGLTNFYLTAAVLTLAVLIQATLLVRIRFLGAAPNLLVVAVVCWSLIRGLGDGLVWGFIGGLGMDVVAGLPVGTSALALMGVSPLAGLGKSSVFPGSLTLPILLVVLATPIHGWIVLLIQQFLGVPVDWLSSTLRVIVPETGLNVLLVPVVYIALRWLAAQIRSVQMEW
jgi:rod shape-determining protein MreD